MEDIIENLKQEYFLTNTLFEYVISLFIILGGVVLLRLIRLFVLTKLKKLTKSTQGKFDDIIIEYVEKAIIPILDFGIIYLALSRLSFPGIATRALNVFAVVLLTFYGIRFINGVITKLLDNYFFSRQETYKAILVLLKIIIWSVGVIFLLDNLGFKISTVVAGLGIGGIAVALAAQAVLADVFCYIAILLDRPFELGDFIVIDDKMGTINKIGLRTTKLVSLSGEQLIFSNSDITKSRVQNFKRMDRRRILFNIGVTYQTTSEQLKLIPTIVEEAITSTECTEFERCFFLTYGDFSLNYEVVYYVLDREYMQYGKSQQEINLKIFNGFKKAGIEFAYPTQTLFVEKTNG